MKSEKSVWEQVAEQGIDIHEVAFFCFDPLDLTKEDYRRWYHAAQAKRPDPVTGRIEYFWPMSPYYLKKRDDGQYDPSVYTYVVLKNHTEVFLNPIIKAPWEGKIPPCQQKEEQRADEIKLPAGDV